MRHIGVSVLRFGIDDIANTIDLKDKDGNINYDRITGFRLPIMHFLFRLLRSRASRGFTMAPT
ncbi:MAG: hypothetical protein HS118_00875 [Bacteroidia bacterium]|nr:hypothetical protein [Bacteroidia bacterium]